MIKTLTKSNLEAGGSMFWHIYMLDYSLLKAKEETQARQEVGAGTEADMEECCLLALSTLLLHLLFFSYQQGQLYRDSTDQCELDSPTSIINQIYGPRTCLQAIPQTRFLLRYVKACVKSTEPNQHRCINLISW